MRFAVATFQRVFDTSPNRDVIGLERLVKGLTTFMIKPKTRDAVAREVAHIEHAWSVFSAGDHVSGRYWSRLERARKAGHDLDAEYQHMLRDARAAPKRDLRLWSPALYPADVKRGSENVIHLSCLVLDYDSGSSVDQATELWQAWFHIVHSTWSHTPEHPKFRLILPLAEPVRPEDWYTVYGWAQERTAMTVDPTGKSVGSTFALPTTADAAQPRVAFSSPGPLLDARLEGLIERSAEPPPDDIEPREPNHFRIPIPGHDCVEGSEDGASSVREATSLVDPLASRGVSAQPLGDEPSRTDDDAGDDDAGDDEWDTSVFPWS